MTQDARIGEGPEPRGVGGDQGGAAQTGGADEGLTQKAQHGASEAGERVKRLASAQLGRRKEKVVEGVHAVGDALRLGADQLRQQKREEYAPYAEQLATRVDRISDYLERADAREVVRDVEGFARRNTALFLGGAFTLGVLTARFLKSSGEEAEQARIREAGERRPREATGYIPPAQGELGEEGSAPWGGAHD